MLVPKELVAWWVKHHSLRLHVLFNRKKKNINNYLKIRMSSFQNRLFNNPNFITLNEREIKKNLPFHVNKEIDYSIIRINYIGIYLRLVSQIFVVVTYNINLALNSEKGAIKIFCLNYLDRRPLIL